MKPTASQGFDWERRYLEGDTPWDLGRPHPELVARLDAGAFEALRALRQPPRVLVPGCGRGHDALALARTDLAVTALDFVAALGEPLASELAALGGSFRKTDALAFEPDEPFQLVFEHTFFCALAPALRSAYGELVRRVLAPGGRVAALVFPTEKPLDAGGPPFGMTTGALAEALGDGFRLLEDDPVARPAGRRRHAERWASFEREA